MTNRHILVIGGGIIGASIAWHLTTSGARVTIIAKTPGGIATPKSFAWINANWGNPEPYFHLRRESMAGWKRLASKIGAIKPNWCGSICYDLPDERLEAFAVEHSAWGYGIERICGAQITALEPNLGNAPRHGLLIVEEGMIEPVEATLALLDDAARHGAARMAGREVVCLIENADRVTGVRFSDGEVLDADDVVIAAGTESRELAATLRIDIPVEASPGLLMHTKPHPPLIRHIIVAPDLEMRQDAQGRIIAATSYAGSEPGENPDATALAVLDSVREHLLNARSLELDHFTVGYRPMPKDGFPIVSRVEGHTGLYIAVTHSGITLAPAIGDMAAREILTGERHPLLAPFHHRRFDKVV